MCEVLSSQAFALFAALLVTSSASPPNHSVGGLLALMMTRLVVDLSASFCFFSMRPRVMKVEKPGLLFKLCCLRVYRKKSSSSVDELEENPLVPSSCLSLSSFSSPHTSSLDTPRRAYLEGVKLNNLSAESNAAVIFPMSFSSELSISSCSSANLLEEKEQIEELSEQESLKRSSETLVVCLPEQHTFSSNVSQVEDQNLLPRLPNIMQADVLCAVAVRGLVIFFVAIILS